MSIFNFWKKPRALTPIEIAKEIKDKENLKSAEIDEAIIEIIECIKEAGDTIGTIKQSIGRRNGNDELQLMLSIHGSNGPRDILQFRFTHCFHFFMISTIDPNTEVWGELYTYLGPKCIPKMKRDIVEEIGEVYSRYI